MEKKLTRSKTDKKLFGVCGGLGKYFECDSTIWRLGFALTTLLFGGGLWVYLIMAIVMPVESAEV